MSDQKDYLSFKNKSYHLQSLHEWNCNNENVLKGDIIGITDENTSTTKNCIQKINNTSCLDFSESSIQLNHRARHINYWKCELKKSIEAIEAEIRLLETQRQQLKNAMDTLTIPEYITEECLTIRTYRMQSDLIFDEPEEKLFAESALIERVKKLHRELLKEIEKQLDVNMKVKEDLEHDWSDKKIAFKFESNNIDLETKSSNVKYTNGATRLSEGQSNVETWEERTINILNKYKSSLDNSKQLRAKVDASLINSSRDLRSQDILVNKVLSERISQTERVKIDLENQLKLTLQKIAETENIMGTLDLEMLKISQRIQVAQTRLNTKHYRPNVENCREGSLISLIEEVRDLNDSMTLLKKRYSTTESLRIELIQERSKIENEIIVKKKTLHLDNERCLYLRSFYQNAQKLCGF